MAETRVKAPGTFCWAEVATSDTSRAKEFYRALFGWTADDHPSDHGTYTILKHGGRDVVGLYELMPEQKSQGVPPHWMPYVLVKDCDATSGRVEELGGRLIVGPTDVMDMGRMSVLADPTGGCVSLWQARGAADAAMGVPGTPCWFELVSTDRAEATAFYAALLGWQLETWGADYTLFKNGEQSVAGAMQRTEEMGEIPSHWMTYLAVEDADAAAERAKELGGSILHPPSDIPKVGRFSVLADPLGAAFSVIRFEAPA
jgi:predicted enzyme related to lactoylglutathione lyase